MSTIIYFLLWFYITTFLARCLYIYICTSNYFKNKQMNIIKKSLIDFYLDYVNNFLTIPVMAEYYQMPEEDCKYLVDLGRKLHIELNP